MVPQEDENLPLDAKRAANYKIIKNKGLTPHRSKEQRNPRVKRRKQYEKAKTKLKSFRSVAVDKKSLGAYGGEMTGIKTNLSRSIKF